MYQSSYPDEFLDNVARRMRAAGNVPVWCVFDNTARGPAMINGVFLQKLLN
jgi:uncharacterized protein YecE (DUF72 family)